MTEVGGGMGGGQPSPIAGFDQKIHEEVDPAQCLQVGGETIIPARYQLVRPKDAAGQPRDQTLDAVRNMRYAASLGLDHLQLAGPHEGRCVIVGGSPQVRDHLDHIRRLAEQPGTAVYALNWTHTWLIQNGIVPAGCLFFEIDAEPDSILQSTHPDTTYYICSHCHRKTFDELVGRKRVLWHSRPNSDGEEVAFAELFPGQLQLGGGIGTLLRTVSLGMALGYRKFDLFGVDSSFPEGGRTHVDGYETVMDAAQDGMDVWLRDEGTGELHHFRTVGYLALQSEEFKQYCLTNHMMYFMRVHGTGLLPTLHRITWPRQYDPAYTGEW